MAHKLERKAIPSSLARPEMAVFSDRLFDLRELVFPPTDEWRCVKISVELPAAAPESGALNRPLADLCGWLERHQNIEALDAALWETPSMVDDPVECDSQGGRENPLE